MTQATATKPSAWLPSQVTADLTAHRSLHQVLLATVEAIRESTAPSAEPTEIELLTDARTYRFRAESVVDRDDCAQPRRLLSWELLRYAA